MEGPFLRQAPSQLWYNKPHPLYPFGAPRSFRVQGRRQVYCRLSAQGNPRPAEPLPTCQNSLLTEGLGDHREKLPKKGPQEWRKVTVCFRSRFSCLMFSLLINKKTTILPSGLNSLLKCKNIFSRYEGLCLVINDPARVGYWVWWVIQSHTLKRSCSSDSSGILLNCKFSLSRSRVGPELLFFQQAPRGCPGC